ncbi:MAG: hypothetical protein ACXWT4_09200 [Methylobacter sp.]
MIKTTKYKPKQRRNSFAADFNPQEDDFPLADVQVIADDTRLRITPLHHLVDDEDAIDRLLVNSGFDIDTGLERRDEKAAAFAIVENIDLADEIDTFDESDPRDDEFFIQEPVTANIQDRRRQTVSAHNLSVAMPGKNQDLPDKASNNEVSSVQVPAKTTPMPDFQENNLAICPDTQADEPETETSLKVTELINESEPVEITIQEFVNPEESHEPKVQQADVDSIAGIMPEQHISDYHVFAQNPGRATPNPFKAELENHKKRLNHYKNKAKKATFISYAALGLAIVSLMSTIAMSMMLIDLKTEVSRLTALLEVVKDDIESLTERDG